MAIIAAIVGTLLVGWVLVEVLWWQKGARCGCAHNWATTIGDSMLRARGGRSYACLRCDRRLTRVDDEWPPRCGEADGHAQDCGWPMCEPVRKPGDLVHRAYRVGVRFVWHGVDAPE